MPHEHGRARRGKEKTMRRLVILLAAFVTALLLGAGVAFAQTMLCTVIEHLSC